jgi:DnaJ-class molecular chaperone
MRFKDYYSILNIGFLASEDEIKAAFRAQATRWHPDKNKGLDTTTEMQEINEAYLILKDSEARNRYDAQYLLFKRNTSTYSASTNSENANNQNQTGKSSYENTDEVLERWMRNAQKQSITLAQQLVVELRDTSLRAIKGAGEGLLKGLKWQLIIGGGFAFLLLIAKGCQ